MPHCILAPGHVAPYMGAWIETVKDAKITASELVAPYMGAWIETACVAAPEMIQ